LIKALHLPWYKDQKNNPEMKTLKELRSTFKLKDHSEPNPAAIKTVVMKQAPFSITSSCCFAFAINQHKANPRKFI
jgi:hypothetical protein